jgi:hypothetical protein
VRFCLPKYVDIISDIHMSATNRYFNSDVPRAAGEQFTGDVPLEKFLTKQLMDARKKKDGFRTNLLRVGTITSFDS